MSNHPVTAAAANRQQPPSNRPASRPRRRSDASRLPLAWTGKSNTREGELYRRIVRQLVAHVGGQPSHAQELLIGRIAWLQVHLARMDERAMQDGAELSEHAGRQYLAWANSTSRMLATLGLEASKPPPRDIRAVLAEKAAQHATVGQDAAD